MKKSCILLCFALLIMTPNYAQIKPVTYKDGEQVLNGFESKPKKSSKEKPGILILPAWKGVDKLSKDSAQKLSDLGYHAFIADIYGEGNYPKNAEEAGKMAGYYKKNITDYQRRIKLALDQLIKSGANPENIVVIGYCFGGTGALEAARAHLPVKGVVSFHGGLGKDAKRPNTTIDAEVLVLHGADDPFVPKEEIAAFQEEMRASKANWEMIYYSNAVHSFTNPESGNDNSKGAAYNEKADKRSWKNMILFLNEVLKN